MDLGQILEWDRAGPVAILMFIVVCLVAFSRWVLAQLLRDKDRQIDRLVAINDRVTGELAATLKQILDALRDASKGGRP